MSELKLYKKDQEIMEFLDVEHPLEVLDTYPYRYDYNYIEDINNWTLNEKVFFSGVLLTQPKVVGFGRGARLARFEVMVQDQPINCTIFNRPWIRNLKSGTTINVWGKYEGNMKVTCSNYSTQPLSEVEGIQAVYRLKQGISINAYRKTVKKIYDFYYTQIKNIIPKSLQNKYRLLDKAEALRLIHFPKTENDIALAVRSLKYEEFLVFQTINTIRKETLSTAVKNANKDFDFDDVFKVANKLPFTLTNDQIKAINEILEDMHSPRLMTRMLQGEVGSGKTLVAALAMYASVLSGYQAAFMAPTEILAIQQETYLKDLFRGYGLNIVCIYSSLDTKKKAAIVEMIENGEADMIVGTHSLIQDSLNFDRLGFVVIDEQHRFGVKQRMELKNKGENVDQLFMSATPIPRTMASVLFSDLDISSIEELPQGRQEIKTYLVKENSMKPIIEDIIKMILEGQRCYVVCPAIEENKDYPMSNVKTIYDSLVELINNRMKLDIDIGLLHGRMSSQEKDHVMQAFSSGKLQLLITTTVIEVGINVKEANIMVIYDAERFGLSQLHQLRGRVGRGEDQGYCYLLSGSKDPETLERLEVIVDNNNGFDISMHDLEIRGPGDVLGFRQSGTAHFVLGDLLKDRVMLEYAKNDAIEILKHQHDDDNSDIIEYVHQLMKNDNIVFTS